MSERFSRRAALQYAAVLTAALAGCSRTVASEQESVTSAASTSAPGSPRHRILVAFFSRAGENYSYGGRTNLDVGNTKVVAGMIRDRKSADLYEIEAVDRYPGSYDEAVQRNRDEQASDALPAIAGALPDVGPYDVVILASPVWSSQAPRIMSTFIERVDLSGKTVLPLVTYAVSGMSGVDEFYRDAITAATVGPGLAVRGEEVRDSGADLDNWLRDNDLFT